MCGPFHAPAMQVHLHTCHMHSVCSIQQHLVFLKLCLSSWRLICLLPLICTWTGLYHGRNGFTVSVGAPQLRWKNRQTSSFIPSWCCRGVLLMLTVAACASPELTGKLHEAQVDLPGMTVLRPIPSCITQFQCTCRRCAGDPDWDGNYLLGLQVHGVCRRHAERIYRRPRGA